MADAENAPQEVSRLPLRALGLKPGMSMQTRRIVEGAKKKEAQYFGAIEGKGVMVGTLGTDGADTELDIGEICVVRGFTGQYEYSFLTKVIQTFEKPFAYALLAYPANVDARLVRHSMRIPCSWPTKLSVHAANGSLTSHEAVLIDLSTGGAMVRVPTQLAQIGENIQITMSVTKDNTPLDLCLAASICHNNRATYEDVFFLGMAFKGLTQQDKLVLGYLTQSNSNAA